MGSILTKQPNIPKLDGINRIPEFEVVFEHKRKRTNNNNKLEQNRKKLKRKAKKHNKEKGISDRIKLTKIQWDILKIINVFGNDICLNTSNWNEETIFSNLEKIKKEIERLTEEMKGKMDSWLIAEDVSQVFYYLTSI